MKNDSRLMLSVLTVGLMLAALTSCSSAPPKQAESKPAEAKPAFVNTYETGREGLQKMYIAARSWQPDAKPFRLESLATKDANGQNGKAGIWTAGFASLGRREEKFFTWSGIKADDTPEPGIDGRPADTYNPANTSAQMFDIAFLKIDSDKAFEEAQKHGGEKLTKKTPGLSVFYTLDWYGRENKLYWHVLYGETRNDPKLAVDIDASTGLFIKVEK